MRRLKINTVAQETNERMKTFIMIDGKDATTFKAENLKDAIDKALRCCNCSNEVIVREIKSLANLALL